MSIASHPQPRIGHLALFWVGKRLPLRVLRSAAGYYIGTTDEEGPVSRESIEYFPSIEVAVALSKTVSGGQRLFLSAMVSFYNNREGAAMLKRIGFEGLTDLGGLDLERRKVIA
ncbi:hypothetical protein RCI35_002019 [Enterobacter hormaechei]|nr:hypothetical protein [Enterobacter hormaechei]